VNGSAVHDLTQVLDLQMKAFKDACDTYGIVYPRSYILGACLQLETKLTDHQQSVREATESTWQVQGSGVLLKVIQAGGDFGRTKGDCATVFRPPDFASLKTFVLID
jgi:hypothetical protein